MLSDFFITTPLSKKKKREKETQLAYLYLCNLLTLENSATKKTLYEKLTLENSPMRNLLLENSAFI